MTETDTLAAAVVPEADDDDRRIEALLERVGQRVRRIRTHTGLSRRQLSERSGVSQRYLAQLESGHGNVSIALLMRISDALGLTIESLVIPDDPLDAEARDLRRLYAEATPNQRARALDILDPARGGSGRQNRVALIGLRGAGKSTLGQLVAHKRGVRFIELNDEIEAASGIAVEEVIALYGQDGYRQLELQALERIVGAHSEFVLAVAGGIVAQPDAFEFLLRNCHTVWLKADPNEHMARVRAQGDERPMAGFPDALESLRGILRNREEDYARASISVDTSGAALDDTLDVLMSEIDAHGFLGPRETAGQEAG